ncbi:hypothetical protein KY290_010823 [Solanum tuberosum]|uniref:Uncharacterized protein n=1 Tax=Solanum tuberosum TaxID=4113 RepID=A0ABQ7W046_SOLTU|nr:hypothetical protein KY290_010823 [Solanum tuberosum]
MLSREHEQEVNNHPQRSKWSKAKGHCENFSQWFEACALQEDVPDLIKQLSRGPNSIAKRYTGCLINGYRFHIRQCDARHKIHNTGVTLVASTTSFASSKDKNPTDADLTYYDPYDQDRHYVMKTVPRDLFNMSDEFESDLPQSYENELAEHLMGPSILEDDGEVPLVRTDVPETVEYEKEFEDESEEECEDGFDNEYEDDSEDESEDESEVDTP